MQPIVLGSARKRGIPDEDILHALAFAIRAYPDQGEYELVVVGPARNGVTLLEVGYDLDEDGRIVIVHAMPARKKYLWGGVITMPRSYDEIVRLSESMAESLESDTEPATSPEEATLRAAALRRSLAETEVGNAVATARRGGVPWQRIGEAVGTSGEAARQKYKHLVGEGKDASTSN